MTDKTSIAFRGWLESKAFSGRRIDQEPIAADNLVTNRLVTVLNQNPGLAVIEKSLCEFLDAEHEFVVPQSLDLQWQIAALAGISLYEIVVRHLLNQTLPISNSILYWGDVLDRGAVGLAIYGLQTLPLSLANQTGLCHYKHVAQLPRAKNLMYGVINEVLNFSMPTWVSLWNLGRRISRVQATYFINAPLISVRRCVKHNKQQLECLRRDIAHRIGLVVSECFKPQGSLQGSIQTSIAAMEAALRIEQRDSETPRQAAKNMLELIEKLKVGSSLTYPAGDSHLSILADYQMPSFFGRWWPGVLLGGYYSVKAIGNGRAIVAWFQDQVVETCKSLWANWIVKPLYQIYQTVRHDEQAQVALMAKQSLESDMHSLERMVIDFAKDIGDSDTPEHITNRVQRGDLSVVLVPYEQQLATPISSLIRGKLIRSLLIQVQKTKVDLEVAMSGIDKMLQSQQLVFGLVAALPTMVGLYWIISYASDVFSGKQRQIRGKSRIREQLLITIGKLRHILLENNDGRGKLTFQGLGLVLCETMVLRELGKRILSIGLYKQWVSDLELIEDINVSIDRLIGHVDRLWMYRF